VKAAATPRALTPMSDTFSKIEVITGVARRSRFSTELELAVVAETMQPRVTNQPCCSPPQAVAEPGVPLEAGDFDQPDAHMGRRERAAASRSLARRLNFDRSGPTNAITRRLRTHTEFARGEPAERGLSRAIRASPFAQQPDWVYFVGYDANKSAAHNTAWIIRGPRAGAIRGP
jgi:hypothetical protein